MAPKRKKVTANKKIDNRGWADLTPDEVICLICKNILNEPIQLPCRCTTRMRCTMCRTCFLRMVSDESSECRSCCPLCNLRLLNWMRRLTRDQTDYKSAIETDLWTQIQEQFQPYNPNGKLANDYGSEEIKRQISSKGEVAEEYRHLMEQKRNQFLEEKSQEEKENLELLNSIEDPELQQEIRKQLEAERHLVELKIRKERELEDEKMALRLQEEEKAAEKQSRPVVIASKQKTTGKQKLPVLSVDQPKITSFIQNSFKCGQKRIQTSSITSKNKFPRFEKVVSLSSQTKNAKNDTSTENNVPDSDDTDDDINILNPDSDSDRTPSPDWLEYAKYDSAITSLPPDKPTTS